MAIILKPGDTAVFIGDSITDCGRRNDTALGLGSGYVRMIHDILHPSGVRVINRGIGGNRTGDLVARWRHDCLDLRPNVLSIMIGINDTWRRYDSNDPTSTEVFEKHYRHLLTEALNKLDGQIVLMEPWLLPVTPDQQAWREDLDPKVEVVDRLAAEFGLTLLPLDAILRHKAESTTADTLADDGVHPTPLGHQIIAQAWLDLTR